MADLREHPYVDLLRKVQKPARYLGGEHGEVRKDWDAVEARMCLAFPDVYDIGMSHLGFKILYSLLNAHPRPPGRARLRAVGRHGGRAARARQPLRSLETRTPLCDFDVVGFSLQFELTYTNILRCSTSAASRCAAPHRGDDDPLVIAGGPIATHPEPLAPFIDAFVIGDGEETHAEIVRLLGAAASATGLPRAERLAATRAARRRVRAVAVRDRAPTPRPACATWRARRRRRCRCRSQRAFVAEHQHASRSPTTARSAAPRPSSIACRSRSRAAAPRAAASARPA